MCERGEDVIMLVGPMKRRVVLTGVISALIPIIILGVLGFFMYKNFNEKIADLKTQSEVVNRYVLTKDILAGQVITASDIQLKGIKSVSDPIDSYTDAASKASETVAAKDMPAETKVALQKKFRNNMTDDRSILVGKVAKFNIKANTVLSESMFYADDKAPTYDLRLQEFNMITLPSDLVENDYIDVRVRFPSGEDYSVLVGKKIERYSNNTIFIKLNEDEILTIGSAIIEAYLLDGAKIYANKYVDPSNQLFVYNNVDFVARYNEAIEQLIAARKEELTSEYLLEHPNATEEEIAAEADRITITEDDFQISSIASFIGLSERETSEIQVAIKNKDEVTLNEYRNKIVTTEKKIARTYPVKENVLNIIKSNPNIVEEVKANFDTDAILAQRMGMMDTNLTGIVEQDKEKVDRLKANFSAEIQAQKEERVAYLRSLLEQ